MTLWSSPLGAHNFYFGNDSWEPVAPGLKSLEDATRIRHKILYAFEAAERETDPERRRCWLTFVIVGAGPPAWNSPEPWPRSPTIPLRNDFRSIHPEESRILLLDASPRVLTAFPESLSAAAERQLVRLGVRVIPQVRVTAIDPNGVTYSTHTGTDRIETRTVLWAAGVKPSPWGEILARQTGSELDRSGRVKVNADLSIPGHPEIFVIGDLAYREQDGVPLAGIAPVAMQEGRYVASVIMDRLGEPSLAAFPVFRQRLPGRRRPKFRRRSHRRRQAARLDRLVRLALRSPDVPGRGAQSCAGFPALGLPICDVLPRRAPDHGR